MAQSLTEKLYLMSRMRAVSAPVLPRLPRPVYWLHCDDDAGAENLLALSERLLEEDLGASVIVTHAPSFRGAPEMPRRVLQPMAADDPSMARALAMQIMPAAVLIATKQLPTGMIAVLGAEGVPICLTGVAPPAPGPLVRHVLRHIKAVLLNDARQRAQWIAAGLPSEVLLSCGKLCSAPVALACNASERDTLADALRHRMVWLAVAVPAHEEETVLAAHREALRESHRLALILHLADPQRGAELAQKSAAMFNTALRSRDEEILPETQVYIADTQGERGLWYRLATTCFIGGTLEQGGARVNPYEAAALGCAVVHGRIFGAYARSFEQLINARATEQLLLPEALGRTISATLRPERAAMMAHRGWQVISEGAEANDLALNVLQDATGAV